MKKLLFFSLTGLIIVINIVAQQPLSESAITADSLMREQSEYNTVTDVDGNIYKAVQIGNQIWMAENLKTTRLSDGTLIPLVSANNEWTGINSSAYCWYNNDSTNKKLYGALYNWYTINTGKLCPSGWYVPTIKEWKLLANFYGGLNMASGKLKDTIHWNSPNVGATNESGFTAIPGGYRNDDGYFYSPGSHSIWWSSSPGSETISWRVAMQYFNTQVSVWTYSNVGGFYTRCLKDTTDIFIQIPTLTIDTISDIHIFQAKCRSTISSNGGAEITARGVCWSIFHNPDITNNKTVGGSEAGSFVSEIQGLTPNTTYYLRAYAINKIGISYSNELSFTTTALPDIIYGSVTDVEGNVYRTVSIGNQTWMADNLKTTTYKDGSPIPNVTDDLEWSRLTSGAYCWYGNDEGTYKKEYGALYNYYTVMDGRNICPTGWHIPTHAEWTELRYCCQTPCEEYHSDCYLKEAGSEHWNYPYNTNETGFTGLPSGVRQALNIGDGNLPYGKFRGIQYTAFFWQSTGEYFHLSSNDLINLYHEWYFDHSPMNGYSVRCMENKETTIHTLHQSIARNTYFEIPVYANILQADKILSYQFDYNFNAEIIQFDDYRIEGTLSSNGSLELNPMENKLSVAWAGQSPLEDSGILLKLKFKALETGITTPAFSKFLVNTDTIRNITNGMITINPDYGDVDANENIQAYDAALALQYSVGLDPLPDVDPLPWENWRVKSANVDSQDLITAYDASLILQYAVGLINSFPVQGYKKNTPMPQDDIVVSKEDEYIVFRSAGELFGMNVTIEDNAEFLGTPQILSSGMLSAFNTSSSNYAIGLATAYPPEVNDVIMKIPITNVTVNSIIFNLKVNSSEKQVVLSLPTAIAEPLSKSIEVYPNPANTTLYFKNLIGDASISIFDLQGRKILSRNINDNRIDITNLDHGLYTIHINDNKSSIIKKLVKQ